MDTQFVWKDEYNIGVEMIDKEHQRLFKIINKLFVFREEEKDSQWTCQEGIKYFRSHAMKHFMDEEAYMLSIGYEGLEQHRLIHKGFRENTLPALEQELERTGYAPDAVNHFLGVCAGWLIGHTLTEDVYYRLVYGTGKGEKKQEILLVFEENLLVNTVGKALGLQTNKLDNMLVHAARYTARQFVGRIMEHFPEMDAYTLQGENLLSYEQFQKIIEKETPQVSLLFNTGGAGYFAYCVIAPHLLEDGVGAAIEDETSMDEVEQYLKERAAQDRRDAKHHRPKVLVVDDSMTIRQGMKQMLEGDCDVSVADSGVAAIRAITLDRPDLVLLDYEMPVCDGRQTLEMLRSDPSFEDVPVIFLTGRRDTESMIKVMPLKPAGYLLKNSKPADIKKEIDAFLAKQKAKQQ